LAFAACSTPKTAEKQYNKSDNKSKNLSRELKKMLGKIPAGAELDYGFYSRAELDSAVLGAEFNMLRWNGSSIDTSAEEQFAVTVNDDYRALVTFANSGDSLIAVDFGATGLAREIQLVLRKFPQATFGGVLRIYKIRGDFLCLIIDNADYYVAMESAKSYFAPKGIQSRDLMTRQDIVDFLNGLK
jgi:hypothetical protein